MDFFILEVALHNPSFDDGYSGPLVDTSCEIFINQQDASDRAMAIKAQTPDTSWRVIKMTGSPGTVVATG